MATGSTWVFTRDRDRGGGRDRAQRAPAGQLVVGRGLGLLLGGAVGNLIDRLFRAPGFGRGHVVDFIAVPALVPVFNVADSCIVAAAVLIGWLGLRGIGIDGRRCLTRGPGRPPDGG